MALGTNFTLFGTGIAAGATGVETMLSLTLFTASANQGTSNVGLGSAASSFVLPSGKKFVIDSIVFASRGHATATAQVTTFTVRFNSGGVAVAGSTAVLSARTATPATSSAWDRVAMQFPGGFELNTGDGTMQVGISANSVFVTNAPTWDVMIQGHYYY
jgi:hypothetical protein